MSYLRANGRLQGRISGRWGRAVVSGRYSLGDIADMGSGAQINGDPVMALIAQLNRFAGKTLSPPGCKPRRYVNAAYAMTPTLTDAQATAAAIIVHDRYACVPVEHTSSKIKWASDGISGDSRAWALRNIHELVVTIAQFGDALGLPPAAYGITEVDKRFGKKLDLTQVLLLGGVAVAGLVLLRRK